VAADARSPAPLACDWIQGAIGNGVIDASASYVGISKAGIAKLADSDFADQPLLVRLRNGHGDWRIVKNAKWIAVWCAAMVPERIHSNHGVRFGPLDIRDIYPVKGSAEARP
jgi:hypothetical protein